MQDLRRKPISLEPVRTSCLFMERTQAPCKVIRKPGCSPSVNLMVQWMRFDADVIKCDPSTFRPLPSERCIESRAEPTSRTRIRSVVSSFSDHHRSNLRSMKTCSDSVSAP